MYNGDLAKTIRRLKIDDPRPPHIDEDGNITVFAPVAEAGAAATVINPTRSELLGGLCKNCHGVFTVGLEIKIPPPHQDADAIRICANCLVTLSNAGQVLTIDWT